MGKKKVEHVQRIKDSEFNRQRPDDATAVCRARCTTGYKFTDAKVSAAGQSMFHHILPVECMQDSVIKPEDQIDFFRDCMAVTKWDINEGDNLIALPTKKPFLIADRDPESPAKEWTSWRDALSNIAAASGYFGTLPFLPCHLNEHTGTNGYNEAVIDYLVHNIWQPLAVQRKDCKIDPRSILSEIQRDRDHWRKFIEDKGAGNLGGSGGVPICWKNRFKEKPGFIADWYKPLSMSPKPQKIEAPPPAPRKKGVKAWCKEMFSKIA